QFGSIRTVAGADGVLNIRVGSRLIQFVEECCYNILPRFIKGHDSVFRSTTPSAVSEHSSELIGCPISRSLTTYCVRLELRSLPSTSVTRLQRYYEPLRIPKAPGLSLAGVRLIIPDHALGSPVLRTLSLCTCCRQYPGAAAE